MRTVTPMPRTLRRRRAKIAEARHQELVERWLATGMAKLVARTERAEIRALEDAGFSVLEACEREGRWWWIMVHEEALRAEDTLRGDPDGALATFDVERQVRQTLVNQIARAERLAPANAKRKLRRWLQDPSRYRAQTQRYRTAFDALCNLREHKRKGEAPGLQTTERGGPSS
jgi:hypothetical protein